ncbi:hypothetical protein [Sediminibacillus massiliensis]|uniref:hypothetical protein n=1 Tax=Sediminibacillus massiliensis TaxID=1926277 RepID=UPI0009885905|nr:hypothetical protein [Sediminibacillus massiliensis]
MKLLASIVLSFLCLGTITGCHNSQNASSIPSGFYSYKTAEVEQAIDTLSFAPEIPGYMPIEVEFIISDKYIANETEKEAMDVSFYTKNNDLLSIQFFQGELESIPASDTVVLNDQIKGDYVDNSFAQILYWQKGDITYRMSFRGNSMEQASGNVTKQDLVKVAESFHS